MRRRISAVVSGAGAALLPVIAMAAEPTHAGVAAASRTIPPPADMGSTLLYTLLGLTGLFVVTTLGYLYRRERNLDWAFQAPAVPHDDHHDAAHAASAAASAASAAPHAPSAH